jgi:hypothetical protein
LPAVRIDGHHLRRFFLRGRRRFLIVLLALGLNRLVAGSFTQGVFLEFEFALISTVTDGVADRMAVIDSGEFLLIFPL